MEAKKTPLYEVHKSFGAKFVPFAGWLMPVKYSGLMEEHTSVRSTCGIFDVSHMGEIEVKGGKALEAVEFVTTNLAAALKDGECQYTLLCNDKGGVIDDTILYRFSKDRFLFCVNAANIEKAYKWIKEKIGGKAEVGDVSSSFAQIALQGPFSENVLKKILDINLSSIKSFTFAVTKLSGSELIVSRTGYTGEDGFELYIKPEAAEKIWGLIMTAGADFGIRPCGLGARDTLRLEMGYPLYGHELDEETTPLEAGLKRFVCLEKDFIGKDAMIKYSEKTLVGFEMEYAIARSGYRILKDGKEIGRVTSGTFSPSLKYPIGMGYVDKRFKKTGDALDIEIRGKVHKAIMVNLPFYRKKFAAIV